MGLLNRKKKVLFYAKVPMNYVMIEPIYNRIKNDPRLQIWFTGKLQGDKDARRLYQLFGFTSERVVQNRYARKLRWDLYISPDFMVTGKRARVKVHTFHGASIRNVAISPRVLDFDKLFLIGPYMKRRLISAGIVEKGDPRLEMIGMPKIDCLVDGTLRKEVIQKRLRLDPSLPTVLYAPTWTEQSSLYTHGEALMKELSAEPVNFLIKLHDNSYDPRKNSIDWREKLKEIQGENVRIVRDFNVAPALFVSDLLISDASSVSSEFLLLDRPIVFMDVHEMFPEWIMADLETWGRKTGVVVQGVPELIETVLSELGRPDRLGRIRREAAADLFYDPGRATDRAVAKVYEFLEMEPL